MLIQVFPLLALSVIVYNILVLVAGDSSLVDAGMTGFLNKGIEIGLFSGGAWKFTIGDLFIVVSLVLLFVEILKSTVTTAPCGSVFSESGMESQCIDNGRKSSGLSPTAGRTGSRNSFRRLPSGIN